jgi:hypothetical protein
MQIYLWPAPPARMASAMKMAPEKPAPWVLQSAVKPKL